MTDKTLHQQFNTDSNKINISLAVMSVRDDDIPDSLGPTNDVQRRTIDFIIQSPHEILYCITGYLDIDSLIKCTEVSLIWHTRLVRSPDLWRNFDISSKMPWAYRILPTVSHHVESLTMLPAGELESMVNDIKLLETCDFRRLQSLTINSFDFNPSVNINGALMDALPNIGSTLRDLRIYREEDLPTELSLDQILRTCRNLTSILCASKYTINGSIGPSLSHKTLLTRIELTSIPYVHYTKLFECSPHLRYLRRFQARHHDDILPVIQHHCPKLEILIVEEYFNDYRAYPEFPSKAIAFDDQQPPSNGLRCLWLDHAKSVESFRSRLEQSQDSLMAVHLTWGTIDDGSCSQGLASFAFKNLTFLHLKTICNPGLYAHLPEMLRCCPALESLHLTSDYRFDWMDPIEGFTAIAELSNLRLLYLKGFNIGSQAFIRMLQRHSTQATSLKSLAIVRCDGYDNPEIIYQIARITSLHELTIALRQRKGVPAATVVEFTRLLSQLPHLSLLQLLCMELNDAAVKNLISCSRLDQLSLSRGGQWYTQGAVAMLEKQLDLIYR